MIPQRYIIATLFIAAMLLLFAVVQAPRPVSAGGVASSRAATVMNLGSYETLAELRLEEGWAPRFQGALDPDQKDPWPFEGGFGAPWEPASPYLADQGLALNGPRGISQVLLWRGLEWRRYRFDAPLCSARLAPGRAHRLLVTLLMGPGRYETRLLEIPEGRVIWSAQSGPWSRFSWDSKAVLLGFFEPGEGRERHLLLSALPVDGEPGDATLASWNEPKLPPPPRGVAQREAALSDDGRDLPGARLVIPWRVGDHLWFPSANRLWVDGAQVWTAWSLEDGQWIRQAAGPGELQAHPPLGMARVEGAAPTARRSTSPFTKVDWTPLAGDPPPWPAYDPAWIWRDGGAVDPWDRRWQDPALPPERQRKGLLESYRPEWRAASELRPSVKGWLPRGPEIALREPLGVAWVWVGDRVLLVRLVDGERLSVLRKLLR